MTERSRRKLLEDFCNKISCHAVAPLYNSRSVRGRLFWSFVLFIAIAGTGFILFGVVRDFFLSPTATSLTVERYPEIPIPNILICNRHTLNQTKLQEQNISIELATYVQHIFQWGWNDYEPRYPSERNAELETQYQSLLHQLPNQDIREFYFQNGVACEEFFISCRFHEAYPIQYDCCKVFDVRLDKMHGKCFLFSKKPKQTIPGFGIQLLIQPHYKNFLRSFGSQSSGLSINIQHQYDPFDFSEILVDPGQYLDIKLEKEIIVNRNTLLKKVCNEDDEDEKAIPLQMCHNLCEHQFYMQHVHCSFPFDHLGKGSVDSPVADWYRICTPKEMHACFGPDGESCHNVTENTISCGLKCLDNCIRHSFRYYISTSTRTVENGTDDKIFIDLRFTKFDVTRISEVDTVTANSVLANIGGAMGIFLGASLVTLVEFVAFAMSFCRELFKRRNIHIISVDDPPRRQA